MYSGKPTASIVVSELAPEHGIGNIDGRRSLNDAGKQAVELTAERLTTLVDEVLGPRVPVNTLVSFAAPPRVPQSQGAAGCSCGSGVPIQELEINGRTVALPSLAAHFCHYFRQRGRAPDAAADELMASVEIYNTVPLGISKEAYREAIVREYQAFLARSQRNEPHCHVSTLQSSGPANTGGTLSWETAPRCSFPLLPMRKAIQVC